MRDVVEDQEKVEEDDVENKDKKFPTDNQRAHNFLKRAVPSSWSPCPYTSSTILISLYIHISISYFRCFHYVLVFHSFCTRPIFWVADLYDWKYKKNFDQYYRLI